MKEKLGQLQQANPVTNHTSIQEAHLSPTVVPFSPSPAVNAVSRAYSPFCSPKRTHTHTLKSQATLRNLQLVQCFPYHLLQSAGSKGSSGSLLHKLCFFREFFHKQTAFSSSIRHIFFTLLFSNINIKQVWERTFIPNRLPGVHGQDQVAGDNSSASCATEDTQGRTAESTD